MLCSRISADYSVSLSPFSLVMLFVMMSVSVVVTSPIALPACLVLRSLRRFRGSSRPISYFSSVATDEYREGWANIFGKPGKVKKGPTIQKSAAEKKTLPKSIRLSDEDITEDLQAVLLEALKKIYWKM